MSNETSDISKIVLLNKVDPTSFDVTVGALLISLGAERYVDIFKRLNIGQSTLTELTDEDLIKLGIDDSEIRRKLIEQVKHLPIYEETNGNLTKVTLTLGPMEITEILEECSQHLHRIHLSMVANTLAVKKTKKIQDCLVHKDKYASDIALTTLSEITNILNSMDIVLHTQLKGLTKESKNLQTNKIIVGTLGTVVISVLAVFFVRSLRNLK